VSDSTSSDILCNPTHFPGPLLCQIRQVVTFCAIRHISLVACCVRLDRFNCIYFGLYTVITVTSFLFIEYQIPTFH